MPNFISEDQIEQALLQRLQHVCGYNALNCFTAQPDDLNDGSGRTDKREETQRVRLAAKDLLHRLIEEQPKLLVQDWHKDNQTQHKVRSEIQRVLDQDLPASYDRSLFKQKCDNVFDLALEYAQRGKKWAA